MTTKDSAKFSDLLGKTIIGISENERMSAVIISVSTGESYMMHHHQDCCEDVHLDDICGDFKDLIGSTILIAEESTNRDEIPTCDSYYTNASFTWTFYKLSTIKGSVTMRWIGVSSGYYSESVDFELIAKQEYGK